MLDVSLRQCRTQDCPHWTREGYRDNPYMKADGMFCWRCRQKHRRQDEQAARRRERAKEKR